jgi:hypothetical protein
MSSEAMRLQDTVDGKRLVSIATSTFWLAAYNLRATSLAI